MRFAPRLAFLLLALASLTTTSAICAAKVPDRSSAGVEGASFTFLYEEARIYVPVSVNGAANLWFILDTGASPTVIDAAVARKLGIASGGDEVIEGAGSGSSHQAHATPARLLVGGTALKVDAPAIADLAGLLAPTSGRAPAGIIGSQLFREHVVEIDFERRRITLFPPQADRSKHFEHSVALTFMSGIPLAAARLTLPSDRTVAMRVVVDLGAKSTLLIPEPFIEKEGLRESMPRSVTTGFGAGVGGDTYYAFARASRLQLEGDERSAVAETIVGLSVDGTLKSAAYDGLLGAEYLERFRLGFDYAASRLLLTRTDRLAPGFDMSGLFLVARGEALERIVVRSVLSNGPGEKAGLRAGDEIVSIEGRSARTLRLPAARKLLKASDGTRVAVVYARAGERRRTMLRLQALL